MRRPRRLRKRHNAGELRAVLDEAVALFWRVRYVADQIHQTGGRSETARGVLRGLVRYGSRTVPQLAFARSVTRQHVQEVVNGLVEEGLVRRIPNPAHKRSLLIEPTRAGIAAVAELDTEDVRTMAAVGTHMKTTRAELAVAIRILRQMREGFEAEY
ncbi:MAG TPA: MarR family transcriptional regulator [Kofleriaceae bacterium]